MSVLSQVFLKKDSASKLVELVSEQQHFIIIEQFYSLSVFLILQFMF